MENYNNDTERMFNIINNNSKNVLNKKEEAFQKSINKNEIKYAPKRKKQPKVNIKLAITSIILIGTISITLIENDKFKNFLTDHIYTPIVNVLNDPIDKKIEAYQKAMDMYSDKSNSIETYLGRLNDEEKVSYEYQNINNLANHLIQASNKSEIDTRCAIIAAYKIINEPYRDEVLGKAFLIANQKLEDNNTFDIPATTNEFLEKLGYENWEEYHKFERENIKLLNSIKENVGGKNK